MAGLEWLARAKRKLEDICGKLYRPVFINAEYITNDEEIVSEEPTYFESKSFWNIFEKLNFSKENSST
jgi:hypothetical protein